MYVYSYSRAASCQVHRDLPLYNDHRDTNIPLFRKQLMYFNVYITSCYFHTCFILIGSCDIKHISRRSHCELFS